MRFRPAHPRRRSLIASSVVSASLSLLLSLGLGCHDPQISVSEYRERKASAVPVADASFDPNQLLLADRQPYQIRLGDVLTIHLVGLAEDRYAPVTIQARVHRDGTIDLPAVDPIKIDGLTFDEAERAVVGAHVPKIVKNLAAYIDLSGPEVTTVLVRGAVRDAGLVKLRQNERNPLYALAAAGGFGPAGSGRVRVRSARPDAGEINYDLNDENDVRRAMSAPALETGDVVDVEAAEESAIYMTGLVNRPGPIVVPPGSQLSLKRAIAAAGGLREYLIVTDAVLIHEMPDGEQVHVKVNLGDVLSGREPDVALASGDIVEVPHTVSTLAQDWFLKNVLAGPFNIGLRYDPLAQYNAERALRNNNGQNGLNSTLRQSLGSTLPGILIPQVSGQ